MAARITVVAGPDADRRFTLVGAEAKVGRGAGHQVALTDPAWPGGSVRILAARGGYLLANLLPRPIYLDGRLVPPDETRTLHDGAVIQPTAATLLRVEVVAAPTGPPPADGVLVEDAPPPRPWLTTPRLAAALAVAVAGWFVYTTYFVGPPRVDLDTAGRLKERLTDLKKQAPTPTVGTEVEGLRLSLTRAVYDDALGRRAEAHAHYRVARDRGTRVRDAYHLAKLDPPATLIETTEFVGERLLATAGTDG